MSVSLRHKSTASVAVPVGAGQKASLWQDRVGIIGLAFLLLSLGVRYTVFVQPRAMEFDQICTLLTAEARSWRAYMAAVPADSQPPFSHIAARFGLLLPLPESIGVHLVSALATALAAVCLFRLFQRRGAPLAELCGAALFTSSRGVEYMYTIRPYAALMAVSAVSLLVYDSYRRQRAQGSRATLWPLAWVIAVAAAIHALSLLYVLLPIIAGELLYWSRTRIVDKRLLTAVGLASTAFLSDFILARQIQTHYMRLVPLSARTPGLPTAAKLVEVMTIPVERRWQMLLLTVVLGGSLVLWHRHQSTSKRNPLEGSDLLYPLLAAAGLYVAAIVAFCMGALNHYFFTRYASPAYLCGALLLSIALSTTPWKNYPAVPLAISAVLLSLPLLSLRAFLRDQAGRSPRENNAAVFQYGDIVASPLAYPTIWWYATPQERNHMRIVTDPDRYRTIPDGIPEAVLQRFAAAGVLPFPLTPYQELHPGREMYLVSPKLSGDTWLPAALQEQGFTCMPDRTLHSTTYVLHRCLR